MDFPAHANVTFDQVESNGEPSRPLDFPPPVVDRGVRVNAFVVDLSSGSRSVWSVIHRQDFRTAALQPKGDFDPEPENDGGSRLRAFCEEFDMAAVNTFWPAGHTWISSHGTHHRIDYVLMERCEMNRVKGCGVAREGLNPSFRLLNPSGY